MKVLVIGAGNMGFTYAEGMRKSPLLKKHRLMIYDASKERSAEVKELNKYDVYDNLEDAVKLADILFIAVKPYHSQELFEHMKNHVNDQQIFISLMAGVGIQAIQQNLGVEKVVRAMPNLPAKVGLGLTSFTADKSVSKVELLMVRNLLDTTGVAVRVNSEEMINASTGISGSGPAYVFYFMESMMEAALKMGFSKKDSKILVTQTFKGAIQLFNESELSPASWMDMVASKGGTTRAALDSMDGNNVNELIKDAAFAAFNRAVELSKEYN